MSDADLFEDLTDQYFASTTTTAKGATPPFWYDNPDAWDKVYLRTPSGVLIAIPGICNVDVKGGYKVDKKQGAGIDGGSITFKGQDFCDVKIVATIWTPTHLEDAKTLLDAVKPVPGKATPTVFSIVHSLTNLYGIDSVAIEKFEGPHPSSRVKGAKDLTLICVQYFPPKKKDATVTVTKKINNQANALVVGSAPAPVRKPSKRVFEP